MAPMEGGGLDFGAGHGRVPATSMLGAHRAAADLAIEQAETWLLRLEQHKDKTMHYTLSPTDAALISRDLLDHPDPDVNLAVTSCLTEVTRLRAPQAAYADDVMKEIFQRIVETFAGLDDINSPSYARRLSILDSFSRVECPVLMLDLDLDHLIRDIFHHFFKAASANHAENVIRWMEHILRAAIEESDDVHVDLASCLLQYLTKVAQETFPASFGLAERVVGSCKDRLKAVFIQLLRGTPLDNYSNIVILLCEDASGVATNNNADASMTDMETMSTTKSDKTKGQQEDNGVSKRKRLQEAEEAPPSKKNKMLGKNLVGSRIRVWWPDDKMFYNGVIESFNTSSKKHKVAYNDGDVEILLLRNERWELIDEEPASDPDVASDMPRGRRGKGSSSKGAKKGKTGTSQRGRPKGVRSSNNVSNTDALAVTSAKDIEETPKTDGKFKKENSRVTRSTAKAKDDFVEASNKDEAGRTKSAKESNDKAGSEDDRPKDEVKSSESVNGSKTDVLSTRRKLKEKEGKSS
ncbi:hypothetical protein EJB05_38865 [Eragrostis curvula]|uniref:Tudor domain-containing protein n=1 Tax=Eragrostis curvula TaxID=38414 RepID=A0A5J9TVZ5_9POAL|nr:hypothetical protein EJB05_38865 [Eragrostis curvula]